LHKVLVLLQEWVGFETIQQDPPAVKKTSGLPLFSSGATCVSLIAFIFVEVHQQKRCTHNQEVFLSDLSSA